MTELGFSCEFEGTEWHRITDYLEAKAGECIAADRLWTINNEVIEVDTSPLKAGKIRQLAIDAGANCFHRVLRYTGPGWVVEAGIEHMVNEDRQTQYHRILVEDKYLAIELKLTFSQVTYGAFFPNRE